MMGLASVALGCAALTVPGGLAHAEQPKRGGTLNFAVVAEPPSYDCHASTTFALIHPIAPHYSLLVKFDGEDYPKVIPDLARSWTVAPDGMTLTFKLKRPVKFHDGSPLTSEDVKASYERIINPPPGVVSIRRFLLRRPHGGSARPSYGGLQIAQPDGRRAGGAGLALQLHL
jgi:peptide/nickel transport system substrate-binding protein